MMQVRFLGIVESDVAEVPFVLGQIIRLPQLTPRVRQWLRDGVAELLRDEPELAVDGPTERAVTRRRKR